MKPVRPSTMAFSRDRAQGRILGVVVVLFSVAFFVISGRRYFNFDEFQVLYASAALLRGKAYYADKIGSHFPLSNLLTAGLLHLTGFKAFALLAARYLIVFANAITCLYVFRIASRLWDRNTGLLAVALLLSTVAFVDKGIEVRHDVFNTLFNVTAAYYGIRYLSERKCLHLVACGLLLGMAVASTQKAIIWVAGIALGVTVSLLREGSYRDAAKTLSVLAGLVPIPLMVSLLGLFALSDESLSSFFRNAVLKIFPFFNPGARDLFPFPHNRYDLLKELVKPNPLMYAAGISGLVLVVVKRAGSLRGSLVLVWWSVLGLLFYLTLRRPFFQSFLPTIPSLAILASGFLTESNGALNRFRTFVKVTVYSLFFVFAFLWPLQFMVPKFCQGDLIERQLYNTAFCVANLKPAEKVLCFSQNQVFFDPVLPVENSICGERFLEYDPGCFERQMVKNQCRVIINDYRTRLLSPEIQTKIRSNYLTLKRGHILIPGFTLKPKEIAEKRIWIEGVYYSPTLSLEVDGRKIGENAFRLSQGPHTIANRTDRSVSLVLLFRPVLLKKRAEDR